jgi:hypothetical protein
VSAESSGSQAATPKLDSKILKFAIFRRPHSLAWSSFHFIASNSKGKLMKLQDEVNKDTAAAKAGTMPPILHRTKDEPPADAKPMPSIPPTEKDEADYA